MTKYLVSFLLFVAFSHVNATSLLLDSQQTINVLKSTSSPEIMSEELLSFIYPLIKDDIDSMQVLSHKRIERLLDSDEPFCTTNRLKTTERQRKYLFSHAIDIYSGLKLYTHKENTSHRQELSEEIEQPVTLSSYVGKFEQGIFAVLANNSYGNVIDDEISKIDESQLYIFESTDPFADFINLFLSKRVQFIVTYPEVMYEYMTSDEHDFVELSIKGEDTFRFGHVMCNKNKENQIFLDNLNNALEKMYRNGVFAKVAKKYLLPNQAATVDDVVATLLE